MATIRWVAAVLLVGLVQGCVSTAPRFEGRFGESVRANLAAQVANPAAAANPDPVSGVDGHAARGAQERYEKSFAQPEAPAPVLINTGK
jgi:type IV pilus biogenesis protein CpaD/CtpE